MVVVPLVVSIAREAKIPYMFLIMPVLAGVAQAHSIFPPQPGPVALVDAFGADSGMVYLLGLVVVVPSIICAGIILPKFLKGIDTYVAPKLGNIDDSVLGKYKLPSFSICLIIPLLPAIFMIGNTIITHFVEKESLIAQVFGFLGSPNVSLLLAVLVAMYVFGIRAGRTVSEASDSITLAIKGISTVVLIIGAGGVFKQVIVDAGVGQHIAAAVSGMSISPLILAFMITVVIRWATGQGAVSAITAAGIVAPLIPVFNVNPTLLMLATAAGSNTITMPNDAAFWMMKETFNLSIGQTFKTWGLLELVNSVVGLGVVLLLSLFI
jgi:high-affinity gluconate transporter